MDQKESQAYKDMRLMTKMKLQRVEEEIKVIAFNDVGTNEFPFGRQ